MPLQTAMMLFGVTTVAMLLYESGGARAATCARDTNVEIIVCLAKDLKVAESNLAKVYKATLAAQTGSKWHQLVVASQRLWIASREKDCRELAAFQWSGGSGEGTAISSCLIARDDDRVRELKGIAAGD